MQSAKSLAGLRFCSDFHPMPKITNHENVQITMNSEDFNENAQLRKLVVDHCWHASRKHTYIILIIYILKLGFTGVYSIVLISAQNIDCGYSLEPPRRGGSNVYLQSIF